MISVGLLDDVTVSKVPTWIGVKAKSHDSLSTSPMTVYDTVADFTFWGTSSDGKARSGPASTKGSCVAVSGKVVDSGTGLRVSSLSKPRQCCACTVRALAALPV